MRAYVTTVRTVPTDPPIRITLWYCALHGVVRETEVYDVESSAWVSAELGAAVREEAQDASDARE